jgi:leucyl aminopeptidase (aminopeptidase T)
MGTLEKGAENAVRTCMGIRPGESVLIMHDRESADIGRAIKEAAMKVTGNVSSFDVDQFGRPLAGIPTEIQGQAKKADVSFYLLHSKSTPDVNELFTFVRPLRLLVTKYGARHAHMPNVTREIMETGMNSDFRQVKRVSDRVFDRVYRAREIIVKTTAGTELKAGFRPEFLWVNLSAFLRKPGTWANLPGDEVYTYPASIEGVAVIDGVLGNFFSPRYGLLEKNPVTVTIKDGRAVKFECKNGKLLDDLVRYLDSDPNGRRVGEFAFGTNVFLKKFIGRNLQDEKFPGVHIAFGNPYPENTHAPYESKVHVDGVMKNVSAWVDREQILEKGKYLL